MYAEPGWYVTDFCIVEEDGLFHMFHIRGERWTWPLGYREIDLGHAISTDLRRWTAHPPVVPAGPAGAWDESGVWAPHVVERAGTYYMFYTGSDRRDNQHIGLAMSGDLFTWHKHPGNPVLSPFAWSDRARGEGVACRDAMVLWDAANARYLLYYTATLADGRACLGLAESADLLGWRDLGPTFVEEDRTYNRCESPFVVAHEGRYYLFYSAKGGPKSKGYRPEEFAHFDIVYLMGPTPAGPWRRPRNHVLLEGWVCASEHPTIGGETAMLYIIQEALDGIWGASSVSAPKRIAWLEDGTVEVRDHGTDGRSRIDLGSKDLAGWRAAGGAWQVDKGTVTAGCPAEGGYLMGRAWVHDTEITALVCAEEGSAAGLVLRGNWAGMAGYKVSLDGAAGRLLLTQMYPGAPDRLLGARAVELRAGATHRLTLAATGSLLEVYLDENLCLVRTDSLYAGGCAGLYARGQATFTEVSACAMEE
jgi:beta-fructofuranosidase